MGGEAFAKVARLPLNNTGGLDMALQSLTGITPQSPPALDSKTA